jgi:anaerobic carbon-monoxide dehydrogenase iron sulfur subunit
MNADSTVELRRKRKVIVAIPEKCIGCRLCELVCSLSKVRCFDPDQAHIHVTEGALGIFFPIKCDHCKNAPCIRVCERKAIFRDKKTGAVVVDRWACNRCGLCIGECPFGMISDGEKSVLKCDLCKGNPMCVSICPTNALLYVNDDEARQVVARGIEKECFL